MQTSFFDQENRLAQLEKLGDPLPRLESIVDWNDFKPLLKKVHQKKRKSNAGRKPYDTILMFKMLVLQSLYNLSDGNVKLIIRNRIFGGNPASTFLQAHVTCSHSEKARERNSR
jgi:IS5 family transposase